MKTLKELGKEAFLKNEINFNKLMKKLISEDESAFDETTRIKVYHNFHDGCEPYFQFQLETDRTHLTTDYYRYDYDFKKGNVNNLDEINTSEPDVEVFYFLGSEIPLN